jgi:hypothetical protein
MRCLYQVALWGGSDFETSSEVGVLGEAMVVLVK